MFCSEPCVVNRSSISISVGSYETFVLKGDVIINEGWLKYDFSEKKDKILPKLKKGDIVNTNFVPVEKETTPPKHYTLETLNNFLKNPFKNEVENKDIDVLGVEVEDEEDYKAMLSGLELGTEATRTGIIENAINSKYISLKNNTYYIEDAGVFYIETLKKLKVDMNKYKTAHVGKSLKDVYKGIVKIDNVLELAKKEISEMMSNKDIVIEKSSGVNKICKCPLCEGFVIKQKWGYGCSDYKSGCKFAIKDVVAGKKITENQVKLLVENGKTNLIKGFTSKSGKPFDAVLKLEKIKDENGQLIGKISFDFDSQQENKQPVSHKCPSCGSNIINDKYAWKCENDCGFSIGYIIAGKQITNTQLNNIITKGQSDVIKGFKSKTGKLFNAALVLEDNKKVKFKF